MIFECPPPPLNIPKKPKQKRVSRWKRLAVLPLLTLALATMLPLGGGVQRASAWSGDLPDCTISGGAFSWAWKDKVQDLLGLNPDDYNGSIIIGKRGADNNVNIDIEVWFSQTVELNQQSPTNRRFIFQGGDGAVNIINNPASGLWQTINTSTAPFSNTVTLSNFTCLTSYSAFDGNPVYEDDYTGTYYGTDIPAQVGAECDTLDIACKINDVFQGVKNTFASVGNYIVRGIASIFLPPSGFFETEFNRLTVFFTEKLGFLTWPIEWFVEFYNAFDSSSNWCTTSACIKDFGQIFGGQFVVDFSVVPRLIPDLWTYFTIVIRGLTVVGFIYMLRKRLMGILKS